MAPIGVVSFNFNNDRRINNRLYSKYAHLSAENRLEMLEEFVRDNLRKGYIVNIFEITEKILNMITEIDFDANFISGTYNLSEGSFKYLVIVPKQYMIETLINFALTSTFEFYNNDERPKTDIERRNNAEYQEFTLGELFEKGALYYRLQIDGKYVNMILVHQGLGEKQRIKQAKKLVEWIEKHLNTDEPIFVFGDFNSFAFKGGVLQEQMDVYLNYGLLNVLPFDESTFTPNPYDILFKLCREDADKYKDFIAKSRDEENDIEKLADEFYEFCQNVNQLETPPVALDNVFTNVKDVEYETIKRCCESDHHAIIFQFNL